MLDIQHFIFFLFCIKRPCNSFIQSQYYLNSNIFIILYPKVIKTIVLHKQNAYFIFIKIEINFDSIIDKLITLIN